MKKLALFHHEPNYDDRKLVRLGRAADWYRMHLEQRDLTIITAQEGIEIRL